MSILEIISTEIFIWFKELLELGKEKEWVQTIPDRFIKRTKLSNSSLNYE